MTKISSSDHALAMLRAELRRLQRVRKDRNLAGGKSSVRDAAPPNAPDAIAPRQSASDPAEALVERLLLEEWGSEIAEAPAFRAIVTEVTAALKRDYDGNALLQSVAGLLLDDEMR